MSGGIDTSILEEAKAAQDSELAESDFDELGFDEEQVLTDLSEGVILLQRAKTLIDYLADPELCKAVSKRERTSMDKLSKSLGAYVNSIHSSYGEVINESVPV